MILEGKVALVTGSTSGIGLAIARAYAAEGAKVMLNGFGDPAEIEKLKAELDAGHDGADLSDPAQIEAMIRHCTAELGAPDILVNNAGVQHVSPVEDFPVDKWDAILAINLSAVFHTTRLAIPSMKRKQWGRIINTASAHSLVASPNKSAYVAAKHGVAGFTKTVALEAARDGVTVNCISPGYVWTPLVENQIPDTMKARNLTREQVMNDVLLAAQPTKRFVTPEEVAALALFLCREEAEVDHGHEPQHGRRLDRRLGYAPMRLAPLAAIALLALAGCAEFRQAAGGDRLAVSRLALGCHGLRPGPAPRLADRLRRCPSSCTDRRPLG